MITHAAAYCYFTLGLVARLPQAKSTLSTGSVPPGLCQKMLARDRQRYAVCGPEGWKKENKGVTWCPTDRQDNKKHRLSRQVTFLLGDITSHTTQERSL